MHGSGRASAWRQATGLGCAAQPGAYLDPAKLLRLDLSGVR